MNEATTSLTRADLLQREFVCINTNIHIFNFMSHYLATRLERYTIFHAVIIKKFSQGMKNKLVVINTYLVQMPAEFLTHCIT